MIYLVTYYQHQQLLLLYKDVMLKVYLLLINDKDLMEVGVFYNWWQ